MADISMVIRSIHQLLQQVVVEFEMQNQSTKLLEERLELVMFAVQELYSKVGMQANICHVDESILQDTKNKLSSSVSVVDYISRCLLVHDGYRHFNQSHARNRMINDFLDLIIAPPVRVNASQSEEIMAFRDLVIHHLRDLPYPKGYTVSTRWREISNGLMSLVSALRNPVHIAVLGMHGSPFYTEVRPLGEDMAANLHRIRASFHDTHPWLKGIGESALALPGTVVEDDGVSLSESLCGAIQFHAEITNGISNKGELGTLVEIGSGYGRLARLFRLINHTKCYILVDLPESLVFSFAFLRIEFPEARLAVVTKPEDIHARLAEENDFVFCPVQLFQYLKLPITDVVVNTWSFSEMPQACVDHLLEVVHRNLNPSYLYSANTIFQDRNLLFESCSTEELQEGCALVLKLEPAWFPIQFDLFTTEVDQPHTGRVYRNGSMVLLEHVDMPVDALVERLLDMASRFQIASSQWVGPAFLAALFSPYPDPIHAFLNGLRRWLETTGVAARGRYDFERIGEVIHLRKRLAAMTGEPQAQTLAPSCPVGR